MQVLELNKGEPLFVFFLFLSLVPQMHFMSKFCFFLIEG